MSFSFTETIENSAAEGLPDLDNARPFARLRVGNSLFDIANSFSEEDLMFRPTGEQSWTMLTKTMENGWLQVSAEILISTRDAVRDYMKMHMINVSGEDADDSTMHLDLFEYRWSMKMIDGGKTVELNLPERGKITVEGFEANTKDQRRMLAVDTLLKSSPEIAQEFTADVESWATRLSAGAVVEPVF